jgi:hypothetical protein
MAKQKLTPFSFFNLVEACAQPGCPFCRLETRIDQRYLDDILYEKVNDPGTQEAFRKSLGLCREHAWQLTDTSKSAALGIAILYRQILRDITKDGNPTQSLSLTSPEKLVHHVKKVEKSASTEKLTRCLNPRTACPACTHRDEMVGFAIQSMLEAMERKDERIQAALQGSDGICRPHLLKIYSVTKNADAVYFLQSLSREKLESLLHELDEFIRKNDYRFQGEGMGKEANSWMRILGWMIGER